MQSLASVSRKTGTFRDFYQGLPDMLAVTSFKAVVNALRRAHSSGKMVIFMLGAHVIKCGLSPLIIDLMK